MAAEAQRAPMLVRERPAAPGKDAPIAPRFSANAGSIACSAALGSGRYADETYNGPALRIFDSVPAQHDVIATTYDSVIIRKGEVAVYDELAVQHEGLVEGAIYAIEYQHPRSHLPREQWATTPGFRMETDRSLIIARADLRVPGAWSAHPLRTRRPGRFVFTDGPYEHPAFLADKLIGRVVGLYRTNGGLQA